ncbi:MAG: hypothetical protein KAW09_07610, partial [Thermoplasmata archaeon]|nr:hypothetical protein [Thermoplasmata archaeon]
MVEIPRLEIDTELEDGEWRQVIDTGDVGVFQTPEMMEVYEKTQRYDPVRIGVRNQSDDRLLAVLLGVVIEVRGGVYAPFSRWSTARGGPCFLEDEASNT